MDTLGNDALAIMDALGLDKVNWCGISMGGMVGQWLGANAPERIEKLILANTRVGDEDVRLLGQQRAQAVDADPRRQHGQRRQQPAQRSGHVQSRSFGCVTLQGGFNMLYPIAATVYPDKVRATEHGCWSNSSHCIALTLS